MNSLKFKIIHCGKPLAYGIRRKRQFHQIDVGCWCTVADSEKDYPFIVRELRKLSENTALIAGGDCIIEVPKTLTVYILIFKELGNA